MGRTESFEQTKYICVAWYKTKNEAEEELKK